MFESGSPPGHATINRGKEDPRFSTGFHAINSYVDPVAPMETFNSVQSTGT
jgi:hypothetical protein